MITQAELKKSKAAIRTFIRMHLSDERLHQVYILNFRGGMCYTGPCLLHVTLCDSLANPYDYTKRVDEFAGGWDAEQGYRLLGDPYIGTGLADFVRGKRLSAILRWEIRRRANLLKQPAMVEHEELALVG